MLHCNKMSLSYLSDKLFPPFELNDKDHSILGDTDPDLSFYGIMNQHVEQCNYYLEPYFNEHIISFARLKWCSIFYIVLQYSHL